MITGNNRYRVAVFLFLALSLFFASRAGAGQPGEPNVLLITIDTLRADHVSAYGYTRETTPNIDKLAEEGVRFEDAYCTVPFTGPSHASILTGLPPYLHGALINGVRIHGEVTTLQEYLQDAGYATSAVVSAWPLKDKSCGLRRGFDTYDEEFVNAYGIWHTQQFGDITADKAIRWLHANAGKKFFLWVHLFDPHQPYRSNPGFTEFKDLKRACVDSLYKRKPKWNEVVDRYDSEILFTDHQVGRILQALRELKCFGKTLVVITADHGESLGERGYNGHGRHLYESSVRVPLVFHFPGRAFQGKEVATEVSTMDIMPTILDFLGIPVDFPKWNTGASLLPLLRSEPVGPDRFVEFAIYSGKVGRFPRFFSILWYQKSDKTLPKRIGMSRDGWKVIFTPEKKTELFNVKEDPTETKNLNKKHPQLSLRLKSEVVENFQKSPGLEELKRVRKVKLDRETREKLKSLGYMK
jgi:choline-sulfatase